MKEVTSSLLMSVCSKQEAFRCLLGLAQDRQYTSKTELVTNHVKLSVQQSVLVTSF